jgi:hypothetical protein
MKITDIRLNEENPRYIKDDRMKKLVNSIKAFPKMMELRPIIVDDQGIILGGNMRYRALMELEYENIPATWVKKAKDLTDEEKKEFIIKDNVNFGMWDMDVLANEWPEDTLDAWGVDIDFPDVEKVDLDMDDEDQTKTFVTEIMVLRNQMAERIQVKKEILISDAYLEAEGIILEMIKGHEYITD